MKKLVEEATIENVLKSIKEDKYNRTRDIVDFIEALDQIEGNMFISLDAKWGAGKTFYVRQIEQMLDYLTRTSKQLNIEKEVEEAFSNNDRLMSLNLNRTYFPVYYNAWLYDNHDDPLMSLILIITKVFGGYCDTKLSSSFSEKMTELLDCFSFSMGKFQIGTNLVGVKDKFAAKDILSAVKTEDEVRDKVKEVFKTVIEENVEKLVVFIDELDRCRPTYAIEMLERIKHYFDDDRIIFVASINKEQLIHSISKCYGMNFDSTGYLDKFFDRNVYLPKINSNLDNILFFTNEQYYIENIMKQLSEYYQLTLRENLRFYDSVSHAVESGSIKDHEAEKTLFSAFVPIIAILTIKDEIKKRKFLEGDSSILDELFQNIPILYTMACQFAEFGNNSEENFKTGYEKIKEVYEHTFNINIDGKRYYKGRIRIHNNFKEKCLKICNGFL
ncbi:P-loop NTPase fold protein [Lachnospiraceae bacterium 48-42]